MPTDLLDGLNPQQCEAVMAGGGPVLVLAGPGSGKTRVLTHRIAYLVRELEVFPGSIVAVTFTNKAAAEMRARVEALLGGRLQGLHLGTFHALCARLLRVEAQHTPYTGDYAIYDTGDQQAVVAQALTELNISSKKFTPGRILGQISAAKNELIAPEDYPANSYIEEVVARVYPRYQELLIENNAMDFDDLLAQMVFLLRNNDELREKYQRYYEYLLVDEFQDTNMAQYQLVQLLGAPQNNIFAVGDEDQGIYAFRGADYRNVLQFRNDFADSQVILLEQNYRSTQVVLDVARSVIDKNPHRTPKALFTERTTGALITVYEAYDQNEEAEYVIDEVEGLRREHGYDYKHFAIMYRTNAQSRALEEACVRANIPFKLVGGVAFYQRREIRDLVAYLRLINNPNDTVSFNRVVNVPKRGIGKTSLQRFQFWLGQNRLSQADALQAIAEGADTPVTGKAAKSLTSFAKMLEEWRTLAAGGKLGALLDDIMGRIGYNMYLYEISDHDEQAAERTENVRELRGLLEEQQELGLNEFLAEIALAADVDRLDDNVDAVTLLTLHAAKGLEYPVVFIAGVEEGLLPHFRSFDDPDGMAEERRLMYVGLTRAMDRVYMTYTFRRMIFGSSTPGQPSRFLGDVPQNLTEGNSAKIIQMRDYEHFRRETTWGASPQRRNRSIPLQQTSLQFKVGVRVYHGVFGEGIVVESRRSGDDDEEVTVAFEGQGVKRLMASFAKLTILDG